MPTLANPTNQRAQFAGIEQIRTLPNTIERPRLVSSAAAAPKQPEETRKNLKKLKAEIAETQQNTGDRGDHPLRKSFPKTRKPPARRPGKEGDDQNYSITPDASSRATSSAGIPSQSAATETLDSP